MVTSWPSSRSTRTSADSIGGSNPLRMRFAMDWVTFHSGLACRIFSANCPRLVAGLDPVLVEARVLDRFSGRYEVAVGHVNRAILGLDDRWIVILARAGLIGTAVQMAAPFPRSALVVGNRGNQRVPALLEIVINHDPVAIAQPDGFQTAAGIGNVRVARRR